MDVDGTLMPSKRDAKPSEKVKKAILRARKRGVHIGLATGRPFFLTKDLFVELALAGPSIVSGGAHVIDSKTHQDYFKKPILRDDIEIIRDTLTPFGVKMFVSNAYKDWVLKSDTDLRDVLDIFINDLENATADEMITEISHIPTIAAHKTSSWTKNKVDFHITHVEATKQHGVWEVLKILGITSDELIAIGESYNDFPLLMASGLKVALENAVPDLKAIADYTAPSVEEDGVAHVIEKFILDEK